ncbi:uncharacterized protein LOC111408153 [Olea europaea var. sylvestris]|uniref:uncharacterized protein LOC111408153 n=1 Tax=Olea europaea var. sylvestris TaxID=158386 RepID=UPI000C1D5F74|nr:uncharacterized protein LOC111408153 [Olea europaea var. sylvestris]
MGDSGYFNARTDPPDAQAYIKGTKYTPMFSTPHLVQKVPIMSLKVVQTRPNSENSKREISMSSCLAPTCKQNNPGANLVSDLLTTNNYETWSRSMQRALRAKNKLGFINGKISKPLNPTDDLFEAWASPELRSSVAFMDDASGIWNELAERFSLQNAPRIYQLKRALVNLSQEGDFIVIVERKLKVLVDRYHRDCTFQFLMGLNDVYEHTRDQIMLIEPLSHVDKVFSYVQQKERQRQTTSTLAGSDSVAFYTRNTNPNFKPQNPQNTDPNKERPYCKFCKIPGHHFEKCFKASNAEAPICSHCNMTGHMVDRCYKLHGYPASHKMHNKSKGTGKFANHVSVQSMDINGEDNCDSVSLTKDQ